MTKETTHPQKAIREYRSLKREHDIPDLIPKADLSPDTIDTLEVFGLEAPTLLNDYACAIEDAFLEAREKVVELREELKRAEATIQSLQLFKKQVLVSLNMAKSDADKEVNDEAQNGMNRCAYDYATSWRIRIGQ